MADFSNLPSYDDEGNVHVVVEAPRGSLVKLKYEPTLGVFLFSRTLMLGVTYPYDWGFIPSTRAEDGDPLDAMVMYDGQTWPGVVIPSKPIGIVRLVQRETRGAPQVQNDRVITVPVDDHRFKHVSDLPKATRDELERFFVTASEMTHKEVHVEGWDGPKAATKAIHAAGETYLTRGTKAAS